ncbi:hypothetical protein [Mobiluncus mulieris]|uniref:hypothetical protein n=1 Tax=Mobiluncus mulieris TaxID=2052 RepID=UPI0021E2DD86|nr:hypothetical protein [Mobiluncus mulieris]
MYPILWDLARHQIDQRREPGQFILTGSTAPAAGETIVGLAGARGGNRDNHQRSVA